MCMARALHVHAGTAALAVLADPATGAQQYYEGHSDDIVCVALHPNGQLVATGQGASAGGAAAELHVWDVRTRAAVGRVGRVLDEAVGDGVATNMHPMRVCTCASPHVYGMCMACMHRSRAASTSARSAPTARRRRR